LVVGVVGTSIVEFRGVNIIVITFFFDEVVVVVGRSFPLVEGIIRPVVNGGIGEKREGDSGVGDVSNDDANEEVKEDSSIEVAALVPVRLLGHSGHGCEDSDNGGMLCEMTEIRMKMMFQTCRKRVRSNKTSYNVIFIGAAVLVVVKLIVL
jgi:hypothetical protein